MTRFNTFRPSLSVLEDRSLMSATLAALPTPPAPLRVELENALISSATPTPQTREHILLARQVGVPVAEEATAGLFRLFGDPDGAADPSRHEAVEDITGGGDTAKVVLFVRKAEAGH